MLNHSQRNRHPLLGVGLLLWLGLTSEACGGDSCPAGLMSVGGRCVEQDMKSIMDDMMKTGGAPATGGMDAAGGMTASGSGGTKKGSGGTNGGSMSGGADASSMTECMSGDSECMADAGMGACASGASPSVEVCDAARVDEDCDGVANEDCDCDAGDTQSCGSSAMGACKLGEQICDDSGSWGTCEGAIEPAVELCSPAGVDEDCDGTADEDCECTAPRSCGTTDVGICEYGQQPCDTNGLWGQCEGAVEPGTEACEADSLDEDCDGQIDEGCNCINGTMQDCGSSSVGECQLGIQTCTNGAWGACSGSIEPKTEICNGKDDDCDGVADNGGASASCGSTKSCSGGACKAVCGDGKVAPSEECEPGMNGWTASTCSSTTCQRTAYTPCLSDNDCLYTDTCVSTAQVCAGTCTGSTSDDPMGLCKVIPGYTKMCKLDYCFLKCNPGNCPPGLHCVTDTNDPLFGLYGNMCISD